MCLIAFNWQNHPDYKMVLIANRDEYFERPSASLHLWEEGFYAGKDLKGGGTWMGMHPNGRFAALTNYRDISNEKERTSSRGELVVDFLKGEMTPFDYLECLQQRKNEYNGFSLLVSDGTKMFFLSNYQEEVQEVDYGFHGLSNALLNTPWPKVQRAKSDLSNYLHETHIPETETMVGLLQSVKTAPTDKLPNTGLNPLIEKSVSAQFITLDDYYGTVNTTAVLWKHNGEVQIREVRFISDQEVNTVQFLVKTS
ncbi:NRDE family protein [Lunatibacter salilacus]|uniref:NRDE family protein n=1 Tax=Lunatibacter salilacus TaxID=2483804 RepID=UPI00131DDEDA|nr:NRDE family protein [Lunatibacter salilacus]